MVHSLAILSAALLLGGMTLYSFGFAALLLSALPAVTAGKVVRQAFPWLDGFVIAAAGLGALCWWPENTVSAGPMVAIALTTVLLRQFPMPAIKAATDTGQRQRLKWRHGQAGLTPTPAPAPTSGPHLGV